MTTPITESWGPVIPASVIAAVPPGSTRASFVWMCVRAEDRGHLAVEVRRHRHFLARRLTVEVDEDHRSRLPRFGHELVDHLPGAQRRGEEQLAEHVDDGDAFDDRQAASRRVLGEIRRPDDPVGLSEVRHHLLAPPGVVPQRDHVGAGGEDLLGELRRDPEPVGRVLAVRDAEVDLELLAHAWEQPLDGLHARRAVHVRDEKGRLAWIASVGAG